MFLFGFKSTIQPEESGMLINFGDTETGSGQIEPPKATPPVKKTPPPPPPKVETPSAAKEAINTQDFEEAAAIAAAKKKEEEKIAKEAEEREIKRQQELELEQQKAREEQEAIEAIEAERQRQEELKRLEQERQAEDIRKLGAAFGKTNNDSQSQGTGEGTGNQGSPEGSTTSNGNGLGTSGNWSLAGRDIQGKLPEPDLPLQKYGKVVVEIAVDSNGKVISATPGKQGTTNLDPELLRLAKEAAEKARFTSSSKVKQIGFITYIFELE